MFKTVPVSRVITISFLQILLILAGFPVAPPAWSQAPQGARVAVVNGAAIYEAEFKAALQQAMHQPAGAEKKMTGARMRALKKKVMANLIGRRLAYQESRRLGISVDSNQIDREMKRVATRFSKAAGLEQALKKANLSRARLRLQFKKDIAIRQLLDARVVRTVKVDDLELRAFYDSNPNLFKTPARVKASHIFIKAGPDSTREARKEAVALISAIRKKLTEGAEFAEMAIDYSQCPTSENGGDLGYFEKEKMIKGFAEAAFGLNPGEISDIVRTRSGYHLIKVTDRQPKTKLAFEDVREKLSRNFKIEKSTHAIKAYLKSLEKSADIKIFMHL